MSKFLTYEDRLIIAQLFQENAAFGVIGKKLGKDHTTIAMLKRFAETVVYINQRINVVCVPSVHCIDWILQRISAPLKQKNPRDCFKHTIPYVSLFR